MSLIVEDGSGLAGAVSYASLATADVYHGLRGNTLWTGPSAAKEAALVRATAYLDSLAYKGFRVRVDQPLAWPRSGVVESEGIPVAGDKVPEAVVRATCEAALRELSEPGGLLPDLPRGGAVAGEKVGPIEVRYFATARSGPEVLAVSALLRGLLAPRGQVGVGRG